MRGRLRTVVCCVIMLLTIAGIPCAAASGFSCEYSPKTEKSALFYIDVYSADEISAAVMELRFDDSIAEYREVSAVGASSSVRAACESDCVRFAFADSGAVTGKLCRVAFKALQTGTCTFTLHIAQAADRDAKLLTGFSDASLEIKLGKDDVVSDASAKSSSKPSSTEKKSSGSLSTKKEASGSDEAADPWNGEPVDVRTGHAVKYILIGAAIVILMAGLVFAGILLGKRMFVEKKPSSQQERQTEVPADEDTSPENEEIEDVE